MSFGFSLSTVRHTRLKPPPFVSPLLCQRSALPREDEGEAKEDPRIPGRDAGSRAFAYSTRQFLCTFAFLHRSCITMSVRVVARLRPLLKSENEKDQIVTCHDGADQTPSVVKIPNPKNLAEEYSFQFNSVYGQEASQQDIFETEGRQDSEDSHSRL